MNYQGSIVPPRRPLSIAKYALITATIVFLLRVLIYVIRPETLFLTFRSDSSFYLGSGSAFAIGKALVWLLVGLPCYGLAGMLAARRAGNIRTGVRTGLRAGMFTGLAIWGVFTLSLVAGVVLLLLIGRALTSDIDVYSRDGLAVVWWTVRVVVTIGLLIVPFDSATGALMGWLGAVLGRR